MRSIPRRRLKSSSRSKRLAHWVLFGILFVVAAIFVQCSAGELTIDNLEAEPGFRMVSLKWKYPPIGPAQRSPISFQVKFCELHAWGLNRCRYHMVDELSARTARQETKEPKTPGVYIADIGGLRMSTNYTFTVIPLDTAEEEGKPSKISLRTKGFSAKATNCLADSSEVIVETGPYFGGRISVEDSTVPGCFLKGNQQSPQTKYSLKIKHKECGSIVEGSRVTSTIIVQENVPILTHSTRRFVVVCSFSPESFVVKAGVSLPRETSVAKSLDFSGLIRISPRDSNLLNHHDSDVGSANHQDIFAPSHYEQRERQHRQISHFNSLTQARHMTNVGESRAFSDSLSRGTWETCLVFGMICVAIVASLASVIWFFKSYRSNEEFPDVQRIGKTPADLESLNGSLPYDDNFCAASQCNRHEDTRSDFEVELDFEFSEDVNRTSNNSINNAANGPSSAGSLASTSSSNSILPQ